jgi:DNA polymerase-1
LRDHLEDVQRNRRLNALVLDLDLDADIDDLAHRPWNPEATRTLFESLEFRNLWDRVQALEGGEEEPAEAAGIQIDGKTLTAGGLAGWLAEHAGQRIGLEVTGSWSQGTGDATGLALGCQDGSALWLDPAELGPADDRELASWLADAASDKAIHSGKGPIEALLARGWQVAGVSCDTELAAYLLRPDRRSYPLDELVSHHLGVQLNAEEQESDQGMLDFGESDAARAQSAMTRAVAVVRLAREMEAGLDQRGEVGLLHDLEMPVQTALVRMERAGIAVDTDVLEGLRSDFDTRVLDAQQEAWRVIGHEVNLGSPKQLQAVLFDELEMPKTRRTKSGYTTDADALAGLFEKTGHPFLEHLLEHRDAIRLRQTVDGLLKSVSDDGRIHTTYQQTVAATGRLSSTDPNLQNIPMRTDEGRRIREGFVVGGGYQTLMSADYSQIEMRIMAHVSGDAALVDAFRSGLDVHTVTASHVFGVEPAAVSVAQRSRIKAMNYGLAYGLSAFGLSQQLHIGVPEARDLMDDYFDRFGKVHDYLTAVVDQARKDGYTSTLMGRRRYLPDLTSTSRQRREMAERAALNAPIQGSAADLIKLAMLATDKGLAARKLSSRVLLQVHDELILEVAPGEEAAVREVVTDAMGHAMDLSVPLTVSIGTGRSWFEAAH